MTRRPFPGVPTVRSIPGSVVGFRGPWGTTYPRNLRLPAQDYTEDQWVELLHTRTALPPMPWVNINQNRVRRSIQ
jgi:hypothetical protein